MADGNAMGPPIAEVGERPRQLDGTREFKILEGDATRRAGRERVLSSEGILYEHKFQHFWASLVDFIVLGL